MSLMTIAERKAKRARYKANKRRRARMHDGMCADVARLIATGTHLPPSHVANQIHQLYVSRGFHVGGVTDIQELADVVDRMRNIGGLGS